MEGRFPLSRGVAGTHGAEWLQFLEVKVKKAHLSPMAPLLVSLSLAFGILVGDLCGYRLLTA
ncbi:MAG: hypothetical protein M3348_04150, partial [Acidobacteriota bacterium]|nr:hypothetical protein [Acidobacteriota bacterium]